MFSRRSLNRSKSWLLVALSATLTAAFAQPQPQLQSPPAAGATAAAGAPSPDDPIVEAREALRKKDKPRLQALRERVVAARHPLAQWVDYWELGSRLAEAQQGELEAFFERWSGSYVEDRLRNDWLLELGRRRDWVNFTREHPRYRMNDDLEVQCYALLAQHLAGREVKAAALAAWYAQRELDDGCNALATALAEAHKLKAGEIWHEMRLSVDANRLRAARAAAALLGPSTATAIGEVLDQPARFLKRHLVEPSGQHQELAVLALMRLAAGDPDAAQAELASGWSRWLDDDDAALAWATIGRALAQRLDDRAYDAYQQAWRRQREQGSAPRWSDDTLAWNVRAALRSPRPDRERWGRVLQAIEAMSPAAAKDPGWDYWKARALKARARNEAERERAAAAFERLANGAGSFGYYTLLAAQDLGRPAGLPPLPPPLTEAEQALAAQTPGLQRGLQMARIGLRDEGRREWNFSLRGLGDRELLAAAQFACQAQDWQLCINTSERTREQVDLRQRYPMPFAAEITARARDSGLEPAFVFGLIRQETRFLPQLRSSAGAAGLMQLMPATARWTARKLGVPFQPEQVTDIPTNLLLGTTYLKLVLDDFAGSQALAAAAYNAGPNRPRRWREGPVLDTAIWAENIPFNETRDYVKKVLANATIYDHLLGNAAPRPLLQRLGPRIGPREAGAAAADANLP
ncbi:MAG: lytic transglycosylase domain-containing protein [Proteobacteria bacterium]|nr:lytic transglycosylase domain-containing protein [Pseudomonadota bacterium]